jgi:hypothetical protein
MARADRGELPAVQWRIQLEGEPWPYGLLGDVLLVWNMRKAERGFVYPIQLMALSPQDGKSLWTTPVRPWLRETSVPWSISLASMEGTIGTWEKGDVFRALRLTDGQDAWSLPRSREVASHKRGLVTAGAGALWLLSPSQGRTLARHRLPADPVLGPVAIGNAVAIVLPGGRLQALDPGSGKVIWERALQGGDRAEPGALLSAGGVLLVALREPGPEAGARLFAFGHEGGTSLWEARVPASERPSSPGALSCIHQAGDLALWPDPQKRCLRAIELATGRERFRTCGLRLESPASRHGDVIYTLGADPKAEAALKRGDPWYSVDYPVLKLEAGGGGTAPIFLKSRRKGKNAKDAPLRQLRALRLPWAAPTSSVLFLVGRNRFLTALQVGSSEGQ